MKWSDQWLQLVEEFVGHPYEAMFAIHIPSLTVRDMDGDPSVIYLGKHSAASIQDLEKIIGVGQFNRLKELIEFCVGNHCRLSNKAPSTCDILTPITIEADQEAYYLVKIRPIISGKSFEPEALLVALAETIPMDDERDWALVSIDKGANLIDLSYTDNHWEDSGSIGFTKRQREELRLTAIGYSVSSICSALGLGESTVKKSRRKIFETLHAPNTVVAIRTATILGLLHQ